MDETTGVYFFAGDSVSSAGDVDGDGYADIIIGAPSLGAGSAWIMHGPVSGFIDLMTEADTTISSEAGGGLAGLVAGGGDLNGDGLDDVVVTHSDSDTDEAVLFFYGPGDGALLTTDADASLVDTTGELTLIATSLTGDVNGDGYDDLVQGSGDDGGGKDAGAVLVFHSPRYGASTADTFDAKLLGEEERDGAGVSADGAGDIDGDGNADLVIGAQRLGTDWDGPGVAYIVTGPFSGTTSLADAHASFLGDDEDLAGYVVAGAGDTNGDGLDDVIIGGPGDDDGGNEAGAAWLLLGPML